MITVAPPATSPARWASVATSSRQSAPSNPLAQKGAAVATETAATSAPTRRPEASRISASLTLEGCDLHPVGSVGKGSWGVRISTFTGLASSRNRSASSAVPTTKP